jgi:hypothetical protein
MGEGSDDLDKIVGELQVQLEGMKAEVEAMENAEEVVGEGKGIETTERIAASG